jgi:hypothetical protein
VFENSTRAWLSGKAGALPNEAPWQEYQESMYESGAGLQHSLIV